MKKYSYFIKGLNNDSSAELCVSCIKAVLPEATDVACDTENSRLNFSAKLSISQSEAEQRLLGALAIYSLELIPHEGAEHYGYVSKKPRKTRTIPLAVAISIIALSVVLTMLICFVSCDFLPNSGDISGILGGTTTTIVVEDDDIPDYIKELIKLDVVFRENSYDGIDEEAMGEMILKAYIAATGDLYAEYMTPEEYESYMSDSNGEFVGIGVSIVNTTIEINGYNYRVMQVISVYEDSPALESGVRVGDYIMYVGGGENRVMVDILGYTEALNLMLGEAGTKAEFTVFRADKSADIGYSEVEFSITRRKVTTQSVKYRISETDPKVGIVNVTGFDLTTAPQFTEAVDALKGQGCEYFVFDMRNNPGGSLYSIEAVLSYFLDAGDLIVSTEYADGTKEADYVKVVNYGTQYAGFNVSRSDIGKYQDLKGKCVVLVNENTASAAELFTATFRDYGIAPIVGETTYGKGCMQNIIDLERYYDMEGALRVTTAMYFSKSHHVYHDIGIVPDYEVQLSEEAMEYNFFLLPESKDDQMQKAINVLFNK